MSLLLFVLSPVVVSAAADRATYSFDDRPTDYEGGHPNWFEQSFLDLGEDLDEALDQDKAGLIVYFGQAHCAYCKAIMEQNLSRPDVVEYVRSRFNVVGLDIHSSEQLTAPDGATMSVQDYALREQTHFTPALIFYTAGGTKALTLRGFYPPYKMRAALEYVADGHYRNQSFRDYLAQADTEPRFDDEGLNSDPMFGVPPYALDRSRFPAAQPLVVVFEQPACHACDVLHTEPLRNPLVRERLKGFELVQLDVHDHETPLITPDGRHMTPHQWAAELDLFYTPTLVFFDRHGRELIRVDAVVQFFRLASVLRYVAERGYQETPLFQQWAYAHAREERRLIGQAMAAEGVQTTAAP